MADASATAQPPPPPVQLSCSGGFVPWLAGHGISLAFTTYQTHRLFLLGAQPDGRLSAFERLFDRAMGLAADPERLYMASRFHLWRFDNALEPGQSQGGYDRLYVPRQGWITGEVDTHDVALDADGRVVFVNTLYGCLATLSDRHSFEPLWHPPFLSRLVPEDRCHLNGLAMEEGRPRFVTAVAQSDVAAGWREHRRDGGCVVDVDSGETVAEGLSMPHSPRLYRDRLWLLNSGRGELGSIDLGTGRFEPLAFCPGYLRGLAFWKNLAIVGLSKPRERTFKGLELDERMEAKKATARCGLMVIDLDSGAVVHWLEIEGVVSELYDVQVLAGVRRPMALGFKKDEIRRLVTFPWEGRVVRHTLTGLEEGDGASPGLPGAASLGQPTIPAAASAPAATSSPVPPAAPARAMGPTAGAARDARIQVRQDIPLDLILSRFAHLSFPDLRRTAQNRPIHEPLLVAVATAAGAPLGAAAAHRTPDGSQAEILSLFVVPEHRHQGLGGKLLDTLEEALRRGGAREIHLAYRTHWGAAGTLERMLAARDWAQPETRRLLAKADERLLEAPWLDRPHFDLDDQVAPFRELTAEEREDLERRVQSGEVPRALQPLQQEESIEPSSSLLLRRKGRLAGWVATHRVGPDLVQYSALWVEPRLQRLGRGIALVAEAGRRQIEAGIPYGIFMVDVDNAPMMRFVQRRLRPYLVSSSELRQTRKDLAGRPS